MLTLRLVDRLQEKFARLAPSRSHRTLDLFGTSQVLRLGEFLSEQLEKNGWVMIVERRCAVLPRLPSPPRLIRGSVLELAASHLLSTLTASPSMFNELIWQTYIVLLKVVGESFWPEVAAVSLLGGSVGNAAKPAN